MNMRVGFLVVLLVGIVAVFWVNGQRVDANSTNANLASRVAELESQVAMLQSELVNGAASNGYASGRYDISCGSALGIGSIGEVELEVRAGLLNEPDQLTGAHLVSLDAQDCKVSTPR